MFSKAKEFLSVTEWVVDLALNVGIASVAAGLGMTGWPLFGIILAGAVLVTITVRSVHVWLSRQQWPETRDVSHLEVKHPLASRRDLEASEITGKTVLVERAINKDNRIADKLFIRCSISWPGGIFFR